MTATTHRSSRVENALWLLDAGTHPTEVAHRLNTNPSALERLLRRHGHTITPEVRAEAALYLKASRP